jgi:uracil-DNA glycosylase
MSSPVGNTSLKRKVEHVPSSKLAEAKKPRPDASIASFFGGPKPASVSSGSVNGLPSSSPALPKFDKAKWVAKLSPEHKTLLKLEINTLDESWLVHLKDEVVTPAFLDLKRFLKSEIDSGKKVFPPLEEIYSW